MNTCNNKLLSLTTKSSLHVLISVRSSLKTLVVYLLLPVFDGLRSHHCDLQTVLFCLNFAESGGSSIEGPDSRARWDGNAVRSKTSSWTGRTKPRCLAGDWWTFSSCDRTYSTDEDAGVTAVLITRLGLSVVTPQWARLSEECYSSRDATRQIRVQVSLAAELHKFFPLQTFSSFSIAFTD